MRSMAGMDLGGPRVLDADLLAKELDLLLEPVVLCRQAYAGVDAVGRPAASRYDGAVSQGDDVQDG